MKKYGAQGHFCLSPNSIKNYFIKEPFMPTKLLAFKRDSFNHMFNPFFLKV